MRKIYLAEATLSSVQNLSFKEKLETARLLDSVNTDIIETCPLTGEKSEEILVKTISAQCENSIVSCPVTDGNVTAAAAALAPAKRPRLNVKLPVSVVQMEYFTHLKAPKMLERIVDEIRRARELCPDVEFTALDATRAEEAYLISAIEAAIDAGAGTVTISDDEGAMLPGEFGKFTGRLLALSEKLRSVTLGVRASDTMSMAEACAFEAVKAGASLVYTRCAGRSMPAYSIFVNILAAKGEAENVYAQADITALKRTVEIINRFEKAKDAEAVSAAEVHTAYVPAGALDITSDIQAVARASTLLGYSLSGEDLAKVYERFRGIAVKKTVESRELDAIIASVALQVPPTYTLASYVVNSGNIITATAHVVLDKHGEKLQGISTGDGPIDAALKAIENVIGHHYELDDFSIQSLTGGQEAVGEALVRLRDGGKLYSGRGISTDIVGSAIRAYINALNKIVYSGERQD
ncbi:MAG: hypothetical protein IKR85_04330 [Clostridia bacterium]|nr:hypothetical protein [Clostridia bacterium]